MSGETITLVACPECEGASIQLAKEGGIVKNGPCGTCEGTGLVEPEEIEA